MEKTTNLRLILTSCSQLGETMMGSTVYLIFVLCLSITRAQLKTPLLMLIQGRVEVYS